MESQSTCNCDQCLLTQLTSLNAVERQKGWEAWYRRDAPALLIYSKRHSLRLGCIQHSEDILQDAFLIAFKNISSGRYCEQGVSLYGYLVGITKNRLREVVRLQRREPAALSDEEVAGEGGLAPADRLYLEEVVHMIREACKQRSGVYQEVVKGLYVEGKSSVELAAELDKSAVNVRAIAHRAVRDIKHHLECHHSLHLSTDAVRACLEVL